MKVRIVGKGAWGCALYGIIKQNNPSVSFLKSNEKSTDNEVIILSCPTQSIRTSLMSIGFSGNKKIVINTAKGIEENTHLLPYEITSSILGDEIEYYSLIGPSFAQEVVKNMPTIVNLASKTITNNYHSVEELFISNYFKTQPTMCVESIELSAAFKNIYAISCGLAKGLGYENNTRVRLILQALKETKTLFRNMNYLIDESALVGTTGDLILTCNSIESRNFKFGVLLANNKIVTALNKINSTVEGYTSLASVEYFEKKSNDKLLLARFIAEVIRDDNPKSVKDKFKHFIKFL